MPNESVNLYLFVQSGGSERALTSLTDKTKALDKETQQLQQATERLTSANKPLREQQTKLQSDMKASQKEINKLQKDYGVLGDELSKARLDHAIEEHARLKQELTEVNAQIGANQKTYKEYLDTVRKGGLSDSGSESAPEKQASSLKKTVAGLLSGRTGQTLASSLGGLGQAVLTSAIPERKCV